MILPQETKRWYLRSKGWVEYRMPVQTGKGIQRWERWTKNGSHVFSLLNAFKLQVQEDEKEILAQPFGDAEQLRLHQLKLLEWMSKSDRFNQDDKASKVPTDRCAEDGDEVQGAGSSG